MSYSTVTLDVDCMYVFPFLNVIFLHLLTFFILCAPVIFVVSSCTHKINLLEQDAISYCIRKKTS